MISTIISRLVILLFGTLYPAYASYKAVKTKNIREYVKWMMYWIVFAIFTAVETFADVFISWVPFYYELKIVFVFWLLSPATRGSSILYRNFVHPRLMRYEPEIDRAISTATEKGYSGLVEVSARGIDLVKQAVITAAIKGQSTLVTQLSQVDRSRSVSLTDMRGVGNDPAIDDFEALGQDLVNGNGAAHHDARRGTRRQRQVDIPRSSSNIQIPGQTLAASSEIDDEPSQTPLHRSPLRSSKSYDQNASVMSSMLYPTAAVLASNLGLGAKLRRVNMERVALWLADKATHSSGSKLRLGAQKGRLEAELEEEYYEGPASPGAHDSAYSDDQEQGANADTDHEPANSTVVEL